MYECYYDNIMTANMTIERCNYLESKQLQSFLGERSQAKELNCAISRKILEMEIIATVSCTKRAQDEIPQKS